MIHIGNAGNARERSYAITIEERLTNPAIAAVCATAGTGVSKSTAPR